MRPRPRIFSYSLLAMLTRSPTRHSRSNSTGIPIIKPTQLAALKVKWHKEKLAGIEPEPPEIPSPLPFHIYRSRMGNLPVYTDLKLNTSRSYTLVRKVSGDVKTLAQLLQHVCRTKVRLYHGRIQITGKEHRERVEEFLTSLGF